jgi:hypothetical protein
VCFCLFIYKNIAKWHAYPWYKKIKSWIQEPFGLFTVIFFVNSMITEGNFIFQGRLITFLMQNVVGECGRHPFTLASMYDAYPNEKKNSFLLCPWMLHRVLLLMIQHVSIEEGCFVAGRSFFLSFSPMKITS